MQQVFEFFVNAVQSLILLLERYEFTVGGFTVNLAGIFFSFLVFGFVAAIFWKGAKA